MACPNPGVPDRIRHDSLYALDQILIDDLLEATAASPGIAPTPVPVPGPRRGFPPLADSQPPVNEQELISQCTPTAPSLPGNADAAGRRK
jgi:hypothetical protein